RRGRVIHSALRAKGTAAAASGLHVRVVKLESRTFECLHVIDLDAIEVEQAGLVDEQLQVAELISLVQHARRILERHGIAETGATTAHHRDPQTSRLGLLSFQYFLHLAYGGFC